MSRSPVTLRPAAVEDVPLLLELWSDLLRRAEPQDQVADLELLVKECAESAERRLVVAEHDAEPVGAVLLRLTTLTVLNLEPSVQAVAPHVLPSHRRKGVGRVLMEAAVTWAEELGVGHVSTAAAAQSRPGNRFMARLSFAPRAVLRVSTTHAVRAQLTALQPSRERVVGRRPLGQVLAARRQLTRRPVEGQPPA